MAGDWIKVELATFDKPEVLQMADLLETTADDVVGKLLRVWGWFDQNSVDGNAGGVTGVTLMKFIDRHVDKVGFAACMKKVGWLNDGGLPNFEAHNGESAKKRALTQKRQKRFRNAHVTQDASPEKRREEKKKTNIAMPDWVPQDAWDSFVEMRKRIKAPLTDRGSVLALAELARLRAAGHDPRSLIDEAVLKNWKSFYPPKDGKPAGLPSYT